MKEMLTLNATDVRKEWGGFIDSVIREKPKLIKRSRDYIFASSLDMLNELLKAYTFTAELLTEADGSITASLKEIDIVVNGKDKEEALDNLACDLVEYAEEFYNEFEYWFSAPNRKQHLPYVLNVLVQDNVKKVKEIIRCQTGKS
jgi:hypothetical protein